MKILRRFDKWMVMVAIVCVAMLTGCGKSAKEGETAPGESKADETEAASAEAQTESEADGEDDASPEGLSAIVSNWQNAPITVSPKGAKANIEDFALAFCSKYDSYEPNKKMLKYFANPKAYNEEDEIYRVESAITNGYIRSFLLSAIGTVKTAIHWWESSWRTAARTAIPRQPSCSMTMTRRPTS